MKYVRKIAIVTLSLLMAILPMTVAPAAMAEEDFSANEWVMVQPGEAVYKDVYLQQELTETTGCKLAKLVSVRGDAASVRAGSKTVYIALESASHLREGDGLVANCDTRIFEEPSKKSSYQTVPEGDKVEFISITGDCVKVRYSDQEGYMYIKHLDFASSSRRFIVAIPTSLE